ncbi:hypothetical protein MN608_02228 [Microdochium nivale]|nr:hypothetical protein MN608_02228 [Microdochium nivale]
MLSKSHMRARCVSMTRKWARWMIASAALGTSWGVVLASTTLCVLTVPRIVLCIVSRSPRNLKLARAALLSMLGIMDAQHALRALWETAPQHAGQAPPRAPLPSSIDMGGRRHCRVRSIDSRDRLARMLTSPHVSGHEPGGFCMARAPGLSPQCCLPALPLACAESGPALTQRAAGPSALGTHSVQVAIPPSTLDNSTSRSVPVQKISSLAASLRGHHLPPSDHTPSSALWLACPWPTLARVLVHCAAVPGQCPGQCSQVCGFSDLDSTMPRPCQSSLAVAAHLAQPEILEFRDHGPWPPSIWHISHPHPVSLTLVCGW